LYSNGRYPFIQTGDVARSKGKITTFSSKYNEVGLAQSKLWPAGTLCITIAANIADSGILEFDACFPDSVVGFIPSIHFENARYFEYFVRTAKSGLGEFAPSTAQKNINLGILSAVHIPIPPLAEMSRIVTKLDELMKLCDQLEVHLTHQQELGNRLAQAMVAAV
jgi:type I restriction enzyme S subunit